MAPFAVSGRHVDAENLCILSVKIAMIDKKLLEILVCPVSKAPLDYDEQRNELLCRASGLAYPIRDGIPVMLESEARVLTTDEKLG
ncbi:Uncharacterised protein [Zhongshania aliphaticivorans]|uniref:UPF0434 protein IHBHHGIJ_01107 n=2 Tax=Zhongshania aliphaticivorans TaxID=1470434 RepID=A0A5S9MP00_9GAMM|nr:Uncharacterised protein [Zhongshania aliphaticivorans]CAA0086743.1 Uncharacterised protein [Zhongshania aliphaticivorans]